MDDNTRYGENPHQKGALYEFDNHFTENFKQVKGEASFNNINDVNGALKIASSFGDENAVCIVKHGNPCGFAIKGSLLESYTEALKCDPVSAFGGVVAVNGVVTKELAEKMNEIFLEVVIAGRITEEAQAVFEKKNLFELIGHADWNDCLNLNCFSETPGESFQTTENDDPDKSGDENAGDDRIEEGKNNTADESTPE